MTPDNLLQPQVPGYPRIHRLGPDAYGWVGCNGRAVALSISLGRELAKATQGAALETLGLPLSEPKSQPLRGLVRRIAPLRPAALSQAGRGRDLISASRGAWCARRWAR